jgi:hypothetical protein
MVRQSTDTSTANTVLPPVPAVKAPQTDSTILPELLAAPATKQKLEVGEFRDLKVDLKNAEHKAVLTSLMEKDPQFSKAIMSGLQEGKLGLVAFYYKCQPGEAEGFAQNRVIMDGAIENDLKAYVKQQYPNASFTERTAMLAASGNKMLPLVNPEREAVSTLVELSKQKEPANSAVVVIPVPLPSTAKKTE